MFNKIKAVKDLRSEAKKIQGQLEQIMEIGEASRGKVKVAIDGTQKVQRVEIDDDMLSDKGKLEDAIKDAINDAGKKIQKKMAAEMKDMGNLPGDDEESRNVTVRKFPEAITNAVAALSRLPGVGPKTALRYVYYLLKLPEADRQSIARALAQLGDKVTVCDTCYTYAESTPCQICADQRRETNTICVVEESRDVATIESTGSFKGRYHVLGGTLNPIEGATPETIRARELVERVADPSVTEVILALSPNVEGETTMMYLSKQLAPLGKTVTRLARGLPMGASLEYADEVTLGDALKGRRDA